jgi:hypothetical protein
MEIADKLRQIEWWQGLVNTAEAKLSILRRQLQAHTTQNEWSDGYRAGLKDGIETMESLIAAYKDA